MKWHFTLTDFSGSTSLFNWKGLRNYSLFNSIVTLPEVLSETAALWRLGTGEGHSLCTKHWTWLPGLQHLLSEAEIAIPFQVKEHDLQGARDFFSPIPNSWKVEAVLWPTWITVYCHMLPWLFLVSLGPSQASLQRNITHTQKTSPNIHSLSLMVDLGGGWVEGEDCSWPCNLWVQHSWL